MKDPEINIDSYKYNLPEERIARYPLASRDESKLLRYAGNQITHGPFAELDRWIPPGSLMIWNDTKVIQARLFFQKSSGARMEIFLLDPAEPSDYSLIFNAKETCSWHSMIGNKKKWKDKVPLTAIHDGPSGAIILTAELLSEDQDDSIVRLSWLPENLEFREILEHLGETPLPPYLKRKPVREDKSRYQTVYAIYDGSVAAPTAGLHFTPEVIRRLRNKKIRIESLTLHVGAGTFVPVKTKEIRHHRMHAELVIITEKLISELADPPETGVTSIGTTTLRSLESLYWAGKKIIENPDILPDELNIGQWEPYQDEDLPSTRACFKAVLDLMKRFSLSEIKFFTNLIIIPGYRFQVVNRLVTNFHQPGSTLLLLVAAFTNNRWQEIYDYAMNNDFRFLSYGDSSILER